MSERKYRQRGYMETREKKDDRSRPQQEKRAPRPPADLPRPGRGMERSANEVYRCWSCGNALVTGFVVTHESQCPNCGSPLHCCRTCTYFDTSARFECTQPIPTALPSKVAANRCEFFQMRAVLDATGRRAGTSSGPADPRAAFDALFKKR